MRAVYMHALYCCKLGSLETLQNFSTGRCLSQDTTSKAMVVARSLLVDTMDMVRKFEGLGLTRRQAEALTQHMTEIICDRHTRIAEDYVHKAALEKSLLEGDAKVAAFKTELRQVLDMGLANANKDIERQQAFLDKMRAEVRHEIDKLTASQRLDLNLEKGRMRDELQALRDKTSELQLQVDRDVNELETTVEKAKNDVIKSVVALLGTFSAIALALSRFMQTTH